MKKRIGLVIAVILICTLFSTCGLSANEVGTVVSNATVDIRAKEIASLEELARGENCDIAGISYEAAESAESEVIREVLDKETILVINNVTDKELDQFADKLHLDYIGTEKTQAQTTFGACLRKQEDGTYLLSEIVAEIAKPKAGEKVIEPDEEEVRKSLDWLEKNGKIDLIEQYHQVKGEELRFSALTASAPSSDESSDLRWEKTFAENSVYYYLYSPSDNNHLATIHICMVGVKVKTDGNRTIDSFVADFTVAAKNDLTVKGFHGKLGTPSKSRYNILGASQLDKDASQSVTVDVTDGSYAYTCKTGEVDIINQVAETAYSNGWTTEPISPSKNTSYTISPSMTVAVSNGKIVSSQAKAVFTYLNLQKSSTEGWVSDQDKVLTIKYKNHNPA